MVSAVAAFFAFALHFGAENRQAVKNCDIAVKFSKRPHKRLTFVKESTTIINN